VASGLRKYHPPRWCGVGNKARECRSRDASNVGGKARQRRILDATNGEEAAQLVCAHYPELKRRSSSAPITSGASPDAREVEREVLTLGKML